MMLNTARVSVLYLAA